MPFKAPPFRKFFIPEQCLRIGGEPGKGLVVLNDGTEIEVDFTPAPMMSEEEFNRLMEAGDAE